MPPDIIHAMTNDYDDDTYDYWPHPKHLNRTVIETVADALYRAFSDVDAIATRDNIPAHKVKEAMKYMDRLNIYDEWETHQNL